MVDGVGSAGSMNLTLDHAPAPSQAVGHVGGPAHEERARHLAEPVRQAASAATSAGSAVINAALHPREAVEHSRKLAATLARDQLKGAPHTSLNVPIGQGRRYALVRMPIDELKRIGHSLDVSMNDVALAACTSGLRSLLIERGERLPVRGLRAMVPVNVRGGSDPSAVGNRVSSLFVDLPVAEPVAIVRLRKIGAATRRLKSSGAATVPSALFDLAALAPPVVMRAALARTAFPTRLFSVTITNVPGPRSTLYAFGAPLREVHPIVPLAADHAVGIAIFSYDGLVTFGLNADAGAMHDLGVLARGIEDGVEDLRKALSHHHTETEAR
jgi:WS/DGAT/MGAT family acyltransferase